MKRFLKNSRIVAIMLSITLLAVVADVHAGRKSRSAGMRSFSRQRAFSPRSRSNLSRRSMKPSSSAFKPRSVPTRGRRTLNRSRIHSSRSAGSDITQFTHDVLSW